MSVESPFNYPSDLNASLPDGTNPKSEGDNHIRGIKSVIKTTFPNVSGAVTPTQAEFNILSGSGVSATEFSYLANVTSDIQVQFSSVASSIALKGAIAGQAWTGAHDFTGATPTVPTAAVSDNTQKAANTAFVNTAIANAALSGGLPSPTGKSGRSLTTDGSAYAWDLYSGSIASAVAIANTETVVVSYVCAANELKAGTTFRFTATANAAGSANTAQPIINIRLGTTTLTGNLAVTATGGQLNSAINRIYAGELTIRTAGASGTVIASLLENGSATVSSSTVTVDTTAVIRIEFTFKSGNALNTYTFQTATVRKIVT